VKTEAKSTKQLYQKRGLLNDIISKSEEHFGADSYGGLCSDVYSGLRQDHTALLSLLRMDGGLSEGCWHLPPHGAEYIEEVLKKSYRSLSIAAHALVTCYSDSISGKTSITQDEEREVVKQRTSSSKKPESSNRNSRER
jgi:hypothetical protein